MAVDKNFKIWGVSYGLIGDLIMGLPVLTYFEKKYPNSYKYWVIEKKVSQCAPLFFNHPLIDNIHITEDWNGFSENDKKLMEKCQIKCVRDGWKHSKEDWYNFNNCVEETAYIAGIDDLKQVLTKEEMIPKLYKWFPKDINPVDAYGQENNINSSKAIAVWPSASYGKNTNRSPDILWWIPLIIDLLNKKYEVWHFGMPTDNISSAINYKNFTNLSFIDQIRKSLQSSFALGTDSGSSWVIAAYNHPIICLYTNWQPNHYQNKDSMIPLGNNVTFIENLNVKKIMNTVERFKSEI